MAEDKVKVKEGKRSLSIPTFFIKPFIGMLLEAAVTPSGDQILTDEGKAYLADLATGAIKKVGS